MSVRVKCALPWDALFGLTLLSAAVPGITLNDPLAISPPVVIRTECELAVSSGERLSVTVMLVGELTVIPVIVLGLLLVEKPKSSVVTPCAKCVDWPVIVTETDWPWAAAGGAI